MRHSLIELEAVLAIVRCGSFRAAALDLGNEVFRDAAQAETARQYSHVVGQAFEGLFIGRYALVQSGHADPPFVVVTDEECRRASGAIFPPAHSFVNFVFLTELIAD